MPQAEAAGANQVIRSSNNSLRCCGPAAITALPAQGLEPLLRLLDSAGIRLRVEGLCLRRIAASPIGSPFGQNERIISLREREACLGTARLGGALEHDPRRADIALPKQHARACHQPCHFGTILRIARSAGSCSSDGCDRTCCVRLALRAVRELTDHPLGRSRCFFRAQRQCEFPLQSRGRLALPLQRFSQFGNATHYDLLVTRSLLAPLLRQRGLLLDVALRRGERLLQPANPLALVLQGLPQLGRAFRRLLEVSGLLAGLARLCLLRGYPGARRRNLLRQRLGLVALL